MQIFIILYGAKNDLKILKKIFFYFWERDSECACACAHAGGGAAGGENLKQILHWAWGLMQG